MAASRRTHFPHAALRLPLLLLAAVCVSSCGGAGSSSTSTAASSDAGTTSNAATTSQLTPGPEATVVRREQNQLLAAYAPLTPLAGAVMSEDALHTVQLGRRTQYARVIARTRDAALRARATMPAQAKVPKSARMRDQMLAVCDSRIDAMRLAARWLAADTAGLPTAAALRTQYLDAWNASIGSARGATNFMQDGRAAVGLEPLPEDTIR